MPIETPNLNSGDVIPEGYFGMLYRDLKSLLLRGDEKYLFVDNTPTGQVVRFRPQAEQRGGGVSGGGSYEYTGYFKIIPAAEAGSVRIIDGGNPASASCGRSDIGSVPAATVSGAAGKDIYLIARYVSGAYAFSFETALPATGNFGYELIGSVSGEMAITQIYTGGMIHFGYGWFIDKV